MGWQNEDAQSGYGAGAHGSIYGRPQAGFGVSLFALTAAQCGAKRFAAGKTLKRAGFISDRLSQMKGPRKSGAFVGRQKEDAQSGNCAGTHGSIYGRPQAG